MTITSIPNEIGRYRVESDRQLQCSKCRHVFGTRKSGIKFCPKCDGVGEPVVHLVDVLAYWGHGQCGCQNFQFRCEPTVSRRLNRVPMHCRHLVTAFYQFGMEQAQKQAEKS